MSQLPSPGSGLWAPALLDLLDRAEELGEASRALEILLAADPGATWEDLKRLTVGQRDARLLEVRAGTVGSEITAVAQCPECGAGVESSFNAEDIGLARAAASDDGEPQTSSVDGHEVVLRAVTAADLCEAEWLSSPDAARASLLRRVVVSVDGEPPQELDDRLTDIIEAELERLDPQAWIDVGLRCPNCDESWSMSFDPARFFWEEISTLAQRLLSEVAVLARVYHWSESEILAMPAPRRRRYIELAQWDS